MHPSRSLLTSANVLSNLSSGKEFSIDLLLDRTIQEAYDLLIVILSGVSMIRIGEITYANCVPIFAALREMGNALGHEFVQGEPSALNRMLYAGEIDLAPCSSFEYGLHSEEYLLVPDLSISADKEVKSVLLLSQCPIENLNGKRVLLSNASATSNVLIQILLKRQYGHQCTYLLSEEEGEKPDARIVIGNAALKAHLRGEEEAFAYDLSLLWNEFTGLPFVFALWIVRRDSAERMGEQIIQFIRDLLEARTYAESHFLEIAKKFEKELEIFPEDLVHYWETISYDLNHEKVKSLMRYFEEAVDMGLLEKSPSLEFFPLRTNEF